MVFVLPLQQLCDRRLVLHSLESNGNSSARPLPGKVGARRDPYPLASDQVCRERATFRCLETCP